jgi:hypothetical protein
VGRGNSVQAACMINEVSDWSEVNKVPWPCTACSRYDDACFRSALSTTLS